MSFEEPYWDVFRAYGTLTSLCAFNCTKSPRLSNDREGKRCEHTFLYRERRWTGGIGILWDAPNGPFGSVNCSFLSFIPGVEGRKRQVQPSVGV